MKNIIKKFAAVIAVTSIIGTASMSVSATTAADVVAAARGAGFLEEYVQTIQNYLNGSNYTSEQYDVMISYLYSAGEEMDEIALKNFGKTIAEMKGQSSGSNDDNSDDNNSGSSGSSGNSGGSGNSTDKNDNDVVKNDNFDDSFLKDLADKMTDENVADILDKMVSAGKELGLNVIVEKKGDKSYTVTVKDKDGNIQLVTPVGKLVDRTGVDNAENGNYNSSNTGIIAVTGTAAVSAGIVALILKSKKKED